MPRKLTDRLSMWFCRILGRLAAWRFKWSNWVMFGYLGRGVHVYQLGNGYVVEQLDMDPEGGMHVHGEAFVSEDMADDDLFALKCALIEVAVMVGEPGEYRQIRDLLFVEGDG